jgi:RND family efflux transporter MFP subunit
MKIPRIGRFVLTFILVAIAGWTLHFLWTYYQVEPWTRDGRVRAEVVQVTPDVSGIITSVRVRDNEIVHKGQVLFSIDGERYGIAVKQAESAAGTLRLQFEQARRENSRNVALGNLVSAEVKEQSRTKIAQLQMNIVQAEAALALARLNLDRTEVKASVDGVVTNLEAHPGDYATAGRPQFALIDQGSLHVVGYFEETKLSKFKVGDRASVRLLGDSNDLAGRVDSIAGGIDDRDRSSSAKLLANVNPTFNWVRLSQRIPVRIAIEKHAAGTALIAGRTATVVIIPAVGK